MWEIEISIFFSFAFLVKVEKGKIEINRAVASLTVQDGQEFHFSHFSSYLDQFFLFSSNLFSSSFWLSGWASRPPGKALATPLEIKDTHVLPDYVF